MIKKGMSDALSVAHWILAQFAARCGMNKGEVEAMSEYHVTDVIADMDGMTDERTQPQRRISSKTTLRVVSEFVRNDRNMVEIAVDGYPSKRYSRLIWCLSPWEKLFVNGRINQMVWTDFKTGDDQALIDARNRIRLFCDSGGAAFIRSGNDPSLRPWD